MAVPRPRDAASDEDEDFHSGRDSGGDETSVFSDSDDDANVVLQPPGSALGTGEHVEGQQPSQSTAWCKWSSLQVPPRPRPYTTELVAGYFSDLVLERGERIRWLAGEPAIAPVAVPEAPLAVSPAADADGAQQPRDAIFEAAPASTASQLGPDTPEHTGAAADATEEAGIQRSGDPTGDAAAAEAAHAVAKLHLGADGVLKLHFDVAASNAGVAVDMILMIHPCACEHVRAGRIEDNAAHAVFMSGLYG